MSGIGNPEMKSIILIFEVHQPFRLKRDFLWARRAFQKLDRGGLTGHYFDSGSDREVFERAARKCYLPANAALLRAIEVDRS